MPNNTNNSWEGEFEKKFFIESGKIDVESYVDVVQFITSLLEKQQKEIREKVIEEIRGKLQETYRKSVQLKADEGVYNHKIVMSFQGGYHTCRQDILDILDKLNGL